MADLEAAIAAEMRRQGCRRLPVGSPIYDCDTCREHLDVWIDTRDACSVVDGAVRAGWDAAINAAAEVIGKKQPRGGVTTDYDQGFLDGWDDHQAAVGREVRALLPEGGDRD